jgi:uncharacterized protein (TIGR02265 family)
MAAAIRDMQEQLEQRLALIRPKDTCRGIFFSTVLEGLKQVAGEDLEARCREAAGGGKFVDFFSYPVSGFIRMTLVTLPSMRPRLGSDEEVLRWMGARSTMGFLNTVAGKTAFKLAGNNVKRLVNQLPISYRASVSYGEREVVWTGEHSGRLIFKGDFMPPAYHEGILTTVVERIGVRNVKVRGRVTASLDSEYELSWEEPSGR